MLLCFFAATEAQVGDSTQMPKKKHFRLRKSIRQANKRLKTGNTYDASDMYAKVLQNDSTDMKIAYKLAMNYYHERDYKKSEAWFQKVYNQAPKQYPLAGYWLGIMMKMNARYEAAKTQLNHFIQEYKGTEAGKYKRWATVDAAGCDLALKMIRDSLDMDIIHLSDSVNSPYSDVSPMLWNDTTLLYGSLPIDTVIHFSKADTSHKERFIHFYSANGTSPDYHNKTPFPQFNVAEEHSANGNYSPDKKRFFYTQCEQDERTNKIRCTIYVSKWEAGQWLPGEKLPVDINLPGYTSTHPCIAVYNKKEVLFYSSDRPGGKGGMDIWYATLRKNGTVEKPRNANKINTDRDEGTPFYDAVNDSLYFSSQGFPGMGGYDIFSVGGALGKWSDPVNVGYHINSQTDDMYYRKNPDQKSGFFVSNRPGIISIRSETCCDDIFAFAPPKPVPPKYIYVQGYVLEKGTEKILDGSAVDLSDIEKGHLNNDTTRNQKMFFFKIDFDKNYKLDAHLAGYFPGSATFNSFGHIKTDTIRQDIYLEKLEVGKAYRLKNVYYDYDKWFLRDEGMKTLDTLYDIMVANPLIIVELGSHTDQRATDYYNIVLSQHRAESCVEYLLARGIPLARLRAKGYGETELMENCLGVDGCTLEGPPDCPCHQLNRRTEFKIIGQLDAPLEYTDPRYGDPK